MKRYIIGLMVFALATPKTFSQEAKLDSLMQVYQSQEDDSTKVETLASIFKIQLFMDSKVARKYADSIISLSQKIGFEKGVTMGYQYLGGYHYTVKNLDSAIYYSEKCIELADKPNELLLKANAIANLGSIAMDMGNYNQSIILADSVSKIYLRLNNYLLYGVTLGDIGHTYLFMGEHSKASQKTFEALKVLDTINEQPFRKADLFKQLGQINNLEGNYAKAIDYYKKADAIYEELSDHLYQSYIALETGNVYNNMNNYGQALSAYQKALELSERYNYPDNIANAYHNIGLIYKKQGEFDKALPFLLKGLDFTQNLAFNNIVGYHNVGEIYSLLGNNKRAIDYLNNAIQLADSLKALSQLAYALDIRSKAYERAGDLQNALDDRKRYEVYSDSVYNIEKTKEIERFQTEYETEKKEAALALQKEEIKTLNEKAKVDKLTKGLYAGGMFSFVTISGLLFFGFRQRMKKNRIEREKQEEIYRKEIEYKKKELASQTLHLVQKNTFLQELKENLDKIKKSPELFKVEFRRLTMLLKKQTAEDKDWEVFKSYFADVHDNFDNKLRALHEGITDKEIRLAAFLRMNLTTKEIAAMFNVIPTSILTSKYRLKKKLGLDRETDLTDFLNTL